MASVRKNLTLFKGEDVSWEDTVYQADGVTVQDITDWEVTFTLHQDLDDGLALVEKTVGSGVELTTPTSGVLTITLAAANTSDLDVGLYWYRVERTDTGAVAVLTYGTLHLRGK